METEDVVEDAHEVRVLCYGGGSWWEGCCRPYGEGGGGRLGWEEGEDVGGWC